MGKSYAHRKGGWGVGRGTLKKGLGSLVVRDRSNRKGGADVGQLTPLQGKKLGARCKKSVGFTN